MNASARIILLAGLLWLGLVAPMAAVQPYELRTADPMLDPWQWRKLPQFDGREPRCMMEAPDGAMWFGLEQGAVRYDGMRWKNFTAAEGLEAGRVTVFARTPEGVLLAGTDAGIFRFEQERWSRIFPAPGAPKVSVTALVCAADGSVWAAFPNAVVRLRGEGGTLFTIEARAEAQRALFPSLQVVVAPGDFSAASVFSIFEDRERHIWLGTNAGGLARIDVRALETSPAAGWRAFTANDGLRPGRAGYISHHAKDGRIWFGSDQHDVGLHCYDPAADAWSYVDLPKLFGTDGLVRSIIETSDGALWVGGFAKLFRFYRGQWQIYQAPETPLSSSRIELLESRSGELWVLGMGDDVQRVSFLGRRWQKYEGLNFQAETPDGRQWFVAVDDGVVCFDGTAWWRHGVADGLMASPAALLVTRKGELWAAGMHEGAAVVARFDGERWQRIRLTRPELAFSSVVDARAAIETPDGALWFGAYVNGRGSGILHYDPAKGPPENEAAWQVHAGPGQPYRYSFGFAVASDGTLYSGSYLGLMRFDGREWTRLDPKPIDALTHSRDGEVWVGTRGAGVYRVGGAKPLAYSIADGLPANGINALFSDRDRNLWVGTSKGISFFDGTEWITHVFPAGRLAIPREGGGFRQSADGSIWINQFSRAWMRRTLPGGALQPAAIRGFSTVRFRRETTAPTTEIVAAAPEVSQPGNTAISWRGRDPWSRTAESELQYSHRLDGGPWSRFSAATSHVLLELAPGKHAFEVRARDTDLNVEATPARTEFAVLPPVWRQPWFVGLVGLLGVAIAAQTYRVIRRDRILHASNRVLSGEIEERRKAEGALQEKTRLLEDKTEELESEIEERRAIQSELERQKTSLEIEIEERRRMEREVERIHKELMMASHRAGMAEVATNVLHNIGNVLNSINVSATVAQDGFRELKTESLVKAADLLETHVHDPGFLANDDKGRRLPGFLRGLADHWATLRDSTTKELQWLRHNIDHVKEIVATQQVYARFGGVIERVTVRELVEDAIRMNVDALARHGIELERDWQADAVVELEKNKVVQILVNLLQNAKNACEESGRPEKRIVVRVRPGAPGRIRIEVSDTGVGIAPENLTRIFNHGFTTRKSGHGFGLHASANAAKSIGGSLTAHSAGADQGATFALELMVAPDATGEKT